MDISLDNEIMRETSIKVVGVGGGGGNAVNRMIRAGVSSVEFISVNTDNQALLFSDATYKVHIGDKLTRGQGAGGDPVKGEKAAEEDTEKISALLRGTDMVFITAGMGGGTGTGAAPVIAKIAHDMGILTVAVVTKPFVFEGARRMQQAIAGIEKLKENVDALLVIPNERLRSISKEPITLANAFKMVDDVLLQAIQSTTDLIKNHAYINVDFGDVTTIMKDAGYAHMGIGTGTGSRMAEEAVKQAITSPLLETSINGARGVIVNFVVSPDTDLEDITEASQAIHDACNADVNLIWGVAFDENLHDELKVIVIATNFENETGFKIPTPSVETEFKSAEENDPSENPEGSSVQGGDYNLDDILKIFNQRNQ